MENEVKKAIEFFFNWSIRLFLALFLVLLFGGLIFMSLMIFLLTYEEF